MRYILILILIPLTSFSQVNQKKVDSLFTAVNQEKIDSVKANLYHKLCVEYIPHDLEKLDFYNNKLLNLSNKINYKTGVGLYNLHLSHLNISQGKEGSSCVKKAIAIFSKSKNIEYLLFAKLCLSVALYSQGKIDEAKINTNESISLALKQPYYKITVDLYSFLGFINYQKGEYGESMFNLKKALYYFNKHKSFFSNNIGMVYFNMAYTLMEMERYDEALYYINKSFINRVYILSWKGLILNKLKRYDEALAILLKNQISDDNISKKNKVFNTLALSETYFNMGKYTTAIEYLNEIPKKNPDLQMTWEFYNLLSKCYLALNNTAEAKFYNDKSLQKIDLINDPKIGQYTLLTRYKIEKKLGNYQNALSYYEKQASLRDEFISKINKERIFELQTDFGVTEKNYKIKELELKELEKSNKIKEQRNLILLVFSAFLLAIFSLFAFIKVYRVLKTKNKLIEKNSLDLNKSNKEKETLLKEIHHRVKNNLQLVMSLLYIQSKQKDIDIDYFLEVSQSRIISMSLIHENLYRTDDLTKVNFGEYINNLTESIVSSYHGTEKDIELKISADNVFLDIQTAIPLGLIINELVNNAYKHAFNNTSKGIVSIFLKKTENVFELDIADNGEGIAEKESSKTSLGLELVKQLVSQIHGVLHVKNNFGLQYNIKFNNIAV